MRALSTDSSLGTGRYLIPASADYIGLKLATIACFDPREATGLWQRMDAAEGDGGKKGSINVDFLSTHPSSSKRVEKVTQWAKEVRSSMAYLSLTLTSGIFRWRVSDLVRVALSSVKCLYLHKRQADSFEGYRMY